MKTTTLVLDSDQGIGTANRFVINLNESIRGCVHSQLRQVILSGMSPSSDYVYVRSGKLGSTIISSQGFGAFDVVPVSKPFRYERYSAVPNPNEFECGRLLNSIDISLVNPDNSLVTLTPSVSITNPDLFDLTYTTNFTDGTSQTDTLTCYVPVGTYTRDELLAAIRNALPPIPLPTIQFSVAMAQSVLDLSMDWTTPSSADTILVNSPLLFEGIGVDAVYDVISTLTSPRFPVTLSTGTYTKEEFVAALENALIPTADSIANISSSAVFQVSLSPNNNVVIDLNWVCLSKNNQVVIQDGTIFSGIGVTSNFTNLPSLSSPMSPVVIPVGAYTTDQLVNAIENALSLTAIGISETFKFGEFHVSVSPSNDLQVQLNWVCDSYGSTITLPTTYVIENVVVAAGFSDGTTQVTSTTPASHIPAGTYTTLQLENAITESLAPVSAAMVNSNNYNSAVFSTDIYDNVVSINLDWVCSSYSDMVTLNQTSFVVTLVITDQSIYNDTSGGFYESPPNRVGTNAGTFHTRITIPAGRYSKGDVYNAISTQLLASTNNNSGQSPQPFSVGISNGTITISRSGFYGFWDTSVQGVGGDINAGFYQNSYNTRISISFDEGSVASDFTLLGLNLNNTYASVSPTGTQNPVVSFTASVSFALCPSFPPALTSINGTMSFSDGDYTILGLPPTSSSTSAGVLTFVTNPLTSVNANFTASTLQQRCTWTFPASVLFPALLNVVPTLQIPTNTLRTPQFNNGWVASAPQVIQQTQEQYSFVWTIPLAFPQLTSASALLTYDGSSSLNSVLGLSSGTGVQTFPATAVSFGTGVKQFTWTFPSPLKFPVLQNVSAALTNGSAEVGLNAGTFAGTEIVFNAKQRRFEWRFPRPPVSSNKSKAPIVVELTTI